MKLSFSTKGWHNSSFDEFCDIAVDQGFGGIELHNVNNRLFTDKDGACHDYTAAATARRLYEKKLQIPGIDVLCDIAAANKADAAIEEFSKCVNITRIRCQYLDLLPAVFLQFRLALMQEMLWLQRYV